MNQVILVGRTTADIEVRYTQNQKPFCSFTLAVDRTKDITDFIRCQAWGQTAEIMKKYVPKGRQIGIAGQIQTGSYTNRDGQKVNTTEVMVLRLELLGREETQEAPAPQPKQQRFDEFVPVQGSDDDLPF